MIKGRLAVLAFVFSLLSGFLTFGVAAIVLAALSIVFNRKAIGPKTSQSYAYVAIVISFASGPLLVLMHEVNYVRSPAPETICGWDLMKLGKAISRYRDIKGHCPDPSSWCDSLLDAGLVDKSDFYCIGPRYSVFPLERYLFYKLKYIKQHKGLCSYAMNVNFHEGRQKFSNGVLLYETFPGWNQRGGREILTTNNHEGKGCNVLFAAGYAEFVPSEDLDELLW